MIESTRSFNDLKQMHHLDSHGIVDRDRRTDAEVGYLRRKNILVPEVAEVENIFLLEDVVKTMAGVFGNAVCFAIWNIAFQRLGVVITNNYLYASPFVTLVVGFLLLDEQITVMSVVGAVLITAGVIVALKKPAGEKAADV